MSNQLLARFANEPTLVALDKQAQFEACLHGAASALEQINSAPDQPSMADDFWYEEDDWRSMYRPYVVVDGVLQIPVMGVLLNNFPFALGSWATGYDYIWRAFERGMGDANVRGIALICDSPGGMVAGNFDLVDKMYALKGTKPIWGFAHESAYSAAYNIISVADVIYVSRTGGVGSIGVVTTHVDQSKMMDRYGVAVTFIFAGAHKVDGNPYEPLPDAVKADIQERIDALYAIFVSSVARNRGLDEDVVRATEARCFMAPQALSNGLADKIGTLDDSLADFSASLNLDEGDTTMADITQADLDQAVAAATQQATVEATAAGATAERARINAILSSDAGKERPKAALTLALKGNMDAEATIAVLADMPKEGAAAPVAPATAGAPAGMFTAAMNGSDNPDLGEAAPGGEDAETDPVEATFALMGKPRKAA